MKSLIGKKLGMTRVFLKDGTSIPVTVIEITKNRITQIKNLKNNQNCILQITTGTKKNNKINKPEAGNFSKAGVEAGRGLWEIYVEKNKNFKIGQSINLKSFIDVKKVDITGTSKGKGFSGTIKRWNFRSQDASHGNSLSHRAPGSIGQNQTPGKVFKGKKMAGQLGNEQVTVQSLEIVSIDIKLNLLLVKGAVPGATGSNLIVKSSVKT